MESQPQMPGPQEALCLPVCSLLSCPSTLDWVCPGAGVGLAWRCDPPCTQEPPSAQ